MDTLKRMTPATRMRIRMGTHLPTGVFSWAAGGVATITVTVVTAVGTEAVTMAAATAAVVAFGAAAVPKEEVVMAVAATAAVDIDSRPPERILESDRAS